MAEDNSIFSEIDESLRVEKLERFWKDHGKKVLFACVGVVLLSVGWVMWKQHLESEHKTQTDILLSALQLSEEQKFSEAADALRELSTKNTELGRLATIRRAQALAKANKPEEATKIYATLANESLRNDSLLQQYAALQASLHSSAPKAAGKENTYAPLIEELAAIQLIKEGKQDDAHKALTKLMENPNLEPSQLQRVSQLAESLEVHP